MTLSYHGTGDRKRRADGRRHRGQEMARVRGECDARAQLGPVKGTPVQSQDHWQAPFTIWALPTPCLHVLPLGAHWHCGLHGRDSEQTRQRQSSSQAHS